MLSNSQSFSATLYFILYVYVYIRCMYWFLIVNVIFRRSSVGTFIRQPTTSLSESSSSSKPSKPPAPKLDYRSMVSVDDMPELFVSFDSKYNQINHLYKIHTYIVKPLTNFFSRIYYYYYIVIIIRKCLNVFNVHVKIWNSLESNSFHMHVNR